MLLNDSVLKSYFLSYQVKTVWTQEHKNLTQQKEIKIKTTLFNNTLNGVTLNYKIVF